MSKLEIILEQELCNRLRKLKCLCIKMPVKNDRNWPDRMVVKPNRECFMVEVKRFGFKARPAQLAKHAELRELGQHIYVIDRPEEIMAILAEEGLDEI